MPDLTPPAAAQSDANRVISFDFGSKRIGVAVGNTCTATSQPLALITAKKGRPNWQAMARVIAEWQPSTAVVGLPLRMNNSPSPMSKRAQEFGALVETRFDLPVVYVDERLSSHAADLRLQETTPRGKSLYRKRIKHRDSLAAQILLETYFSEYNSAPCTTPNT